MNQPPLVTEEKNCSSKSGPKVSKQLFEKPLKFAGKWVSQGARVVKNSPANAGDLRDPVSILGSGRSPGEGLMATHSNILPGKFIGKRSLVGYSP